MANSYGANTFVIDTDVNVAGLTALKGSAPTTADNILVVGTATLTIDASLDCKQLAAGYGALNGASPTNLVSRIVVSDGIVLTQLDGERFYLASDCHLTINGTMRSIGTGTGAADQSYAQLHADNDAVQVGGEWWTYVPSLTGYCVTCGVTNASNTIQVASDPRLTGLAVGDAIEIRATADGTLVASRTVISMTATTIVVGGGLTTTAAHAVYRVIAAGDRVYSTVGGNIVFGDGTASAWNNNGGAIPALGDSITSPGVTWRSSAATTGIYWMDVSGRIAVAGCCVSRHRQSSLIGYHVYRCQGPTFTDCAFGRSPSYGFSAGTGCDLVTLTRCIAYANTNYGFTIVSCSRVRLEGCVGHSNSSYGFSVSYAPDVVITDCRGYANYAQGLFLQNLNEATVLGGAFYRNQSYGIGVSTACTGVRIQGTRALAAATPVLVYNRNSGVNYSLYRTELAGDAGTLYLQHSSLLPEYPSSDFYIRTGSATVFLAVDSWYVTRPMHTPGLVAWGAATNGMSLGGGASVTTEYRVSHDYGRTWTAWAAIPAVIADAPDLYGEVIQFRAKRTNAAGTDPVWASIAVACTFDPNFVRPAAWDGVHDVLAAMRSRVVYQGGPQQ